MGELGGVVWGGGGLWGWGVKWGGWRHVDQFVV